MLQQSKASIIDLLAMKPKQGFECFLVSSPQLGNQYGLFQPPNLLFGNKTAIIGKTFGVKKDFILGKRQRLVAAAVGTLF
jgi:hypothetical protein